MAAYHSGRLSLFLGAGVSAPYGIPTWNDLVTGLLLDEAGGRFRDFYPHYQSALAWWLAREFGFTATRLARVVRYNIQKGRGRAKSLPEAIRARLYATLREPATSQTLLSEVVELVSQDPTRIRRIVNFNFDDLLLTKLRDAGLKAHVRDRARAARPRGLEIVHPHGFLPRSGKLPPGNAIVFTEDEYNRISVQPFHWAATEVAATLTNTVALFLGLSMNDPNLLRVLDAVPKSGAANQHFLFRLDYTDKRIDPDIAVREIQDAAMKEFDRTAAESDRRKRYRWIKKDPRELEAAFRAAFKQAHDYDRQLFKDLGIRVIWAATLDDMPEILKTIRTSGSRPAKRLSRTSAAP